MKYKVLMADCIFKDQTIERDALEAINAELIVAPDQDITMLVSEVDAVLVTYADINAHIIRSAKKCKIIVRTGIGVNNVDITEASKHGIVVSNVPDYCIKEVADHTMALLLNCLRKISYYNETVHRGVWDLNLGRPIPRTSDTVLGFFGFGNIAQAVAARAKGFEMKLAAFDPYVPDEIFDRFGVERKHTLEELASTTDFLSLHAPLNEETKGSIDRAIFKSMKSAAYLINTSRGGIVNEDDLCEAVRNGEIAGCSLDVMETEPGNLASELLQYDQVCITPHAAFYSDGSDIELRKKSVEQIVRYFTSGEPEYWVNRSK